MTFKTKYGHIEYSMDEMEPGQCHLEGIFINENHRGNGHARALLSAFIEKISRCKKYDSIGCYVHGQELHIDDDRLADFIKEFGFKRQCDWAFILEF